MDVIGAKPALEGRRHLELGLTPARAGSPTGGRAPVAMKGATSDIVGRIEPSATDRPGVAGIRRRAHVEFPSGPLGRRRRAGLAIAIAGLRPACSSSAALARTQFGVARKRISLSLGSPTVVGEPGRAQHLGDALRSSRRIWITAPSSSANRPANSGR